MNQIKKVAVTADGHKFFIKDTKQDLHTQYGVVLKSEFRKQTGKSNTGKEFKFYKPQFIDAYKKIKRGPQMIPLKDLGVVIAHTGLSKESVVVDAGSGSGGASLLFGKIAKKVYSYDIREDFHEIAKKNRDFLGLKNVEMTVHDITEGIPVDNVDMVFLDMPTPWLVVRHAQKALKKGGFLVSYSPTVPQVMDFVEEVERSETFITPSTIEVFERNWEVIGRKVRPKSQTIGHSGFLTFTRYVG